ncbi:hypothetical protein [Sphingomonas sp. TREG-RG-20F-R18-01]|uniref:hypothetical protein n=1 Tax=Sphingomonas sp. TREG-RG-20F-R18-01 TaxID=2914982 RepID=UPI001F58042A|nr:hypothetical protein [Sphingomonas sp. TREG-RG-20F-R18-01]
MEMVAKIGMAIWLAALAQFALYAAWNPRKPFILPFDRAMQVKLYLFIAAGAVAEAVTLWTGGLWS